MATKTWIGTNGASWTTPTNWFPTGVPNSGDEITFDNPTGTNTYINYTGATFSGSVDFTISSTTAQIKNISGSTASATTASVFTFSGTSHVRTNWDTPDTNVSGTLWRNVVNAAAGTTIFKEGNGFWGMRGGVTGTFAPGIYVNGGYLVALESNAFGTGFVNLNANGTGISLVQGTTGYSIGTDLYIDAASVVLGRYSATGTYGGTMTMAGTTYLRKVSAGGSNTKTLNCNGNPIVLASLGGGEAGFGRCGFTKTGASTLIINGAPVDDALKMGGNVRVDGGAVVVNSTDVFKFSTMEGNLNKSITLGSPYLLRINGLTGTNPWYIWNGNGNSGIVDMGWGNTDCSYSGVIQDDTKSGQSNSGDRFLSKFGTAQQTFSGASTTTAYISVFDGGKIRATTSVQALGAASSWVRILNGQIVLDTTVNKNELFLQDNNTDRGCLYVGSGDRAYNCSFIVLEDNNGLTPLEAASGATLRVACTAAVYQGLYARGIRKLGEGDVVLSAPVFSYTGQTRIQAGRMTLSSGNPISDRPVTLAGGTLLDTPLDSGCTLAVEPSYGGSVQSSSASASSFTNPTTVPASTTLTLTPTVLAAGRPVKVLGGSPLTVNGTLRTGATLGGRMTYGANLTFNSNATLRLG